MMGHSPPLMNKWSGLERSTNAMAIHGHTGISERNAAHLLTRDRPAISRCFKGLLAELALTIFHRSASVAQIRLAGLRNRTSRATRTNDTGVKPGQSAI